MSIKSCPKCNNQHSKPGKFCSRSCANSRGPRTTEFKEKVSAKLKGKKKQNEESIKRGILKRGRRYLKDEPNTICIICNKNTNTKSRKTCSQICYIQNQRLKSQQNPKCGGQKHTHRSKIYNIEGNIFIAESSYEVDLSIILNELNIKWIRPSYFWYYDKKENKRRYYPDFYLPNYDLYLDPKNEFLIKNDIDKIIRVVKENNIKIVVLGKNKIEKNYIEKMVGDTGLEPVTLAV